MSPFPHCFLAGRWWILASGGFDAGLCDPDEGVVGVSWNLTKWLGHIAHGECLWWTVDTSFQLSILLRGDGYPCGGRSWAHWSVALLSYGYLTRTLSNCSPIGAAGCEEKDLHALQFLWKRNIRVCSTLLNECVDRKFLFRPKVFHSIEAPNWILISF